MTTIDRIFKLLNEHNMTAKDLAKAVGLSGGNITDWKTGRSKPSVSSLKKIANYFNVTVDYLLGNADKHSYTDTLIRYLKPLNLTSKQFQAFKDMAIVFVNGGSPEEIASTVSNKNFSKQDIATLTQALDIIADLADEFEKTTKLNKIAYNLHSYTDNIKFDTTNKDSYDYNILNIKTHEIVKQGLIESLNNINENLVVSKIGNYYNCPVYGQISAGLPNWAEECLEGYLPIDPNLMNIINPEECFFLRVNGESMNKVIRNGAYALIRKQDIVENGEIAAILVNGDNATIKKFTKQGDLVVLEPMSDDNNFQVQIYDKSTSIKILGKYIGKFEINN